MKRNFKISIYILTAFWGSVLALSSCKQEIIRAANFPDQKIYMPTAYAGYYVVNTVAQTNQTYRYQVDLINKKFNIPLSAYRSGSTNDGGFNIDIAAKADTIQKLITNGALTATDVLPAGSFSLPASVYMNSGFEVAPFSLSIDLNYLISNIPKQYAISVGISSTERAITFPANLGTTIVIIDTKMLVPASQFAFTPDATTGRKINFSNTSTNSLSYTWDFGDGTPAASDLAPSHTYATSGTYAVKLTATGIAGTQNVSTKSVVIP